MNPVWADMHIHTALSPCAENEMTPCAIVDRALETGLGVIAVTDHNCAGNAKAVCQAGAKRGLFVLPGMELQTREEVHLLCLFPSVELALIWQDVVFEHLPDQPNRPDYFGEQLLLDENGLNVGEQQRLLLNSTDLGVEQAVHMVAGLGGICVPAHVDRPSYSLLANLGFVPPELPIQALEVSWRVGSEKARSRFGHLGDFPFLCSSDAHRLAEVGMGRTALTLTEASFESVVLAISRLGRGPASGLN